MSEPRFRCLPCLDSGWRTVWLLGAVLAIRDNRLVPRTRTGVVRCACTPVQNPTDKSAPLPRFDPLGYCPVKDNDSYSEKAIQAVRDWIENATREYFESKRETSFDKWNSTP